MRSPDPDQLADQLRGVLEPVVTAAGLEIDAVEVRTAGRRHAVKLVVDLPESSDATGIDLDDIARLSRSAATELDPHEHLIEGSYTLEVTSPGTDRPLTTPRHWRRNFLRLARISLTDGAELHARIGRAGAERVQVAIPGKKQPEPRELAYAEISHAQVQVEFKPAPAAEVALLDPERAAADGTTTSSTSSTDPSGSEENR
ncbi:ribosome maturation factor RimP [Pseudonocardia sp. HH130630-07]|uniref:ribosome maturation factor RimP n=1 Tax=Pseudonocardia sp. HH130630-07 TaxID=1690815 RepID=UPI000839C68E|nr:ribosome maturation factor RimP [Pseudonocardia sp. HH130630-07]